MHTMMKRFSPVWPALALIGVIACQPEPRQEVQQEPDQLSSISAEKDQLLSEVAENARLISDINAELTRIKGLDTVVATDPGESPAQLARQTLMAKLRKVVTRLEQSEQRVAAGRARLRALSQNSDSLKTRIAELEQSVSHFEDVVQNQQVMLTALQEQIDVLHSANLALRDTNAVMADTIRVMDTRENTAYYIVGTEQELIEQGVLVKEGGARPLFIFGRRGQTLRPAVQLDPTQFTPIDIRQVTEIPLPDSAAAYQIASRQNVSVLATPPARDGKVRGRLQIAAPDQFWMPSKFLIVVRS